MLQNAAAYKFVLQFSLLNFGDNNISSKRFSKYLKYLFGKLDSFRAADDIVFCYKTHHLSKLSYTVFVILIQLITKTFSQQKYSYLPSHRH
jgi:hypothetical protein